jgi:hypothetical protein
MYKVTTSKTFSEGKSISENRYSASDMTKKNANNLFWRNLVVALTKMPACGAWVTKKEWGIDIVIPNNYYHQQTSLLTPAEARISSKYIRLYGY